MEDAKISLKNQKFLLTIDLNRLAKWLRMMGIDAAVIPSVSVSELIRRTIAEGRTLLTRSVKISQDKRPFPRILIHSVQHLVQLNEIIDVLDTNEIYYFTRCLCCNRPLYPIQKEKLTGLIPDHVYHSYSDFHVCRYCGKFYWPGTHWLAMKNKVAEILESRA